ncbi:hypothetical protein BGX34_009868 [Mortierella sp. NVP85]|nr:hypothetical protein BGX34_009868 [Mortierella sp. NVP85]
MMQHRAAFLPPLVRDLVCYDETALSLDRQESDTHSYLNDQGLLFVDAIRPCLPQSVVTAVAPTHDTIGTGTNTSTTTATSVEPCDLYPFKIACVKVQSELLKLSKDVSIPLRELYTDSLEWLGIPGLRAAEIWFELYENQMFDQALIVGSTVLEQLVSNIIFTLQGPDKFIPFLVRDLLAVRCLDKCVDKTLIQVLKTMIGSPLTLNIRNLLWHGFILLDDDIPLDTYGAMLIAVTMTIAHGAKAVLSTPLVIRHQNPKAFYIGQGEATTGDFDVLYEKIAFGSAPLSLNSSQLLVMMDGLVNQSHFITPGTTQQWVAACQHLKPECNSSFVFVMTTLPLLEHALRLLYVSVNQCKQDRRSALIAGEYYLTLDVILNKMVPAEYYDTDSPILIKTGGSGEPVFIPNQLYSELGVEVMNLLNDLFIHSFGPRIRDRTSHGELNSYLTVDITRQPWFNYYTGLVVHLLCKYLPSTSGSHQEAKDHTSWIAEHTCCRFDEWSVLKRETARCQSLLLEYSALVSAYTFSDAGNNEDSNSSKSVSSPPSIDLILAYDDAIVFSSQEDLSESSLESQLWSCLSSWPGVKLAEDNAFATSNLSAWILIVQSIQSAIQKVTAKIKALSEQLRQRQLSSRSRKQFEGMKPVMPRLLGMLKGCLVLVEHFVLNPTYPPGRALLPDTGVRIVPDMANANETSDSIDRKEPTRMPSNAAKTETDKSSSADEILLRLKITTFVDKFVSNFDRVKLNMIEPVWEELVKTVAAVEARGMAGARTE